MDFENKLKKMIPNQFNSFPKLRQPNDNDYYFDRWDVKETKTILRYWFWNQKKTSENKKYIIIEEIKRLYDYLKRNNKCLDRTIWKQYDSKNKGAPCNFAVITHIFKKLETN